ncbi:MAG: ParB N-terminal domain-containing protein [Chloroflexota bacterium]|nr:ParB N-terminal domain-containing protein [Chloroflexota bacterium]
MKVAIQDIIVGERRREDMGDMDGLAQSIVDIGLLHPIVIDDQNRLVAGERRLAACKSLGLADIDAKRLGELSDDELRKIELEENLRRKNLEPHERSKFRMAVKEQAASSLIGNTVSNNDQEPRRGRPKSSEPSSRDVGSKAGVSHVTVQKAAKHVAAVERYPFMKRWPQAHALAASKALDALPESKREEIIPHIQSTSATKGIANVIQRLGSPNRLTSTSPLETNKPSQAALRGSYDVDLRTAIHHLSRAVTTIPQSHRNRLEALIVEARTILNEVPRS